MPDGNRKIEPEMEPTYITIDPEEFNEVCKRLNKMLHSRLERAWQKKSRRPSSRTVKNHVEAAKEAFAFIHLLDLIEHMSQEIYELRQEVGAGDEFEEETEGMGVFSNSPKKNYMN
jgi:hypothetical protein